MKIRAVLTDLDGTLLEPDTTVHPDVPQVLARLAALGVPLCPVTSKTPGEIEMIVRGLGMTGLAGFENGAGIRHASGSLTLGTAAVLTAELGRVLTALKTRTRVRIRSFQDLSDQQLAAITGLLQEGLEAARQRVATMPLVVDPAHDETLRAALPADPPVRVVRGNLFLHLQGRHDKADVVPLLLAALESHEGVTVACGDAPNDVGLLAAADIQVIVPSTKGPHPVLLERFPTAMVAPAPNGRGWAAAIIALLGTKP